MRNSFDYYKQVEKPNMYLCNPNQKPIGAVNAENRHLTLRFNDLSELTFTVPKIKGTERVYSRIETRRLIFVEQIGWFQITNVTDNVDGNYESKDVTCESHQTQLKTRGFISEERVYMFYNPNDPLDALYNSSKVGVIPSVIGQLYQQIGLKINLSIGDVEVDHDYVDWTVIYIDEALKFKSKNYGDLYVADDAADNICRTFSEETTFGYDFIVNKVEQAFEVVFEFDFLYHTIKVKKLEDITKPTNIYLSLDNLAESISVTENAEDIITVLSCNGNDLDIRTVNPMGTNYIVNFDYYKKRTSTDGTVNFPWMSERLIETLDDWQTVWEENKQDYSDIVVELQNQYLQQTDISKDIQFANLKLTDLQAARDQYTAKEDDGSGIIIAESVDIDDVSLSPTSSYHSTGFQENDVIQSYQSAPAITKNSAGDYTTSFSGTAKTGTAKSMLLGFVSTSDRDDDGEWAAADDSSAYLYFSDDSSKKSYCKLRVASEIGVVKDSSGNIAKNGTVTVRGNTFSVTTSTDYFYVTPTDGAKISVSKSKSSFIYNGEQFKITQSADGITSVYCYYVAGFKRYSTYKTLTGESNWFDIWSDKVADLKADKDAKQKEIDELTVAMKDIAEECDVKKFVKNRGDDLYNEFLNYWIEGEYSDDSIAALDSTTMDERIKLAQELMAAGTVELQKVSQPTFELSVSAVNFIKLIEFRTFTDQLELGRVITVERDDDTHYRPALTSIEYDLDESDTFNLTFSTAGKLDETEMTFADLLNESSSTSRTISANWSNLTDYWKNKDEITNLINAPLDRTLRATQANMANQEFTIDTTGILGRKWSDDSHTAFSKEQVRIVNNTIIFTDDNWETAKTALGKVYFDHYDANGNKNEAVGYGLLAEVLVGSLIMGENLQIRNDSNSILLDKDGITIKDSNKSLMFQASTAGNVYVKGRIYATSLQLGDNVSIEYSKLDGVPDFATIDEMHEVEQSLIAADGVLKSEISEIYATKDSLNGEITTVKSLISQTSDDITLSVSQNYATKSSLELYVQKDDNDQIVSMLNASADTISLTSNRLIIQSNNFILTKDGTITAKAGHIGAFEITDDGLESNYIRLTSQEISFPIQSSFNLNNEVRIYTLNSGGENTSYITTVNTSNFIVQNLSGAGIKFYKDKVTASQTITLTIKGPDLTSAGEKGNALVINYSTPSPDTGWGASYDFLYTATLSAPLTYPYSKTFYIQYAYRAGVSNKTKAVTVNFPAYTTTVTGTVNLESWGESVTRYNPNDSRFETGIYFSSFSRTNAISTTAASYSSTNNTLYSLGNFSPDVNSKFALGDNSGGGHYWGALYVTGTNTGSDLRLKDNIERLGEKYEMFFDALNPVRYELKSGTSHRKHIGFIAQEVEAGLMRARINTKDFAGLCAPGEDEAYYTLRYDEFIPLNTWEIQKLKSRVGELEKQLKELKGEME